MIFLMEEMDKNGESGRMLIYQQMKDEYREMLGMLKEQGFPRCCPNLFLI